MLNEFARSVTACFLLAFCCLGQQSETAPSKPRERIIGTITSVDRASHTITVKQDNTGIEYTVQLAQAGTLLKVEPGAKDLKNATRITAGDLATGDRVEIG